jgi:HD-like signal output (HDOD) protein
MKHVLFLHEDNNFLERLEHHLVKKKDEWDMFFYTDPNKAFTILEQNHIDVIVSDLRESSKFGATFLSLVSQYFPNIIRIVLVDKADINSVISSIRPSHQFIYEPAAITDIEERLEKVLHSQDYISNKQLLRDITKVESLPSLPTLYMEVTNELAKENYDLSKVSELISKDIAMTAQLMKVVNSPYFGIKKEIKNIHEMVMFLGTDYVKNIILATKLFNMGKVENSGFIQSIFEASEKLAGLAKFFCESFDEHKDLVSTCYLAAMMQELGVLIYLRLDSDLFRSVSVMTPESIKKIDEIEKERFGETHGGVGAYLLTLWGFNFPSCNAIAYRNNPSASSKKSKVLFYLHMANVSYYHTDLDEDFIRAIKKVERLPKFEQLADQYFLRS